MGSSKKIVKGVAWTTILNIVNAIYNFIAVPILIGYFGKEQYGLIGLAMSINVYMRLMDMGLNSTNVRFYSAWLAQKEYDKVRKSFQTSLSFYGCIGLVNAVILLIICAFSESIFNVTPEQNVILQHLLIILSVSAFCNWFSSCFDQLIKSTENVDWIQRRQLIPKFLQIFILFATISLHFSIEFYYVLTCLATLSIVPISIRKIKLETPFVNFIPHFDKLVFREMLPYALNIFSFSLFQFSFYHLRPVLLGIQGTVASVADYRILGGVTMAVHMIGGAFLPVLLPSASKVKARNDMKSYYRIAYDGTKYISILLCFCTFGMMAIGQDILTVYVGKEYLYLIPWLNLWLICNLVIHNQAISSLILSGSDIRAISYNSAIASVLGLICTWFFIPIYHVGGAVIGFAVYGTVQMLFYYLYYWPQKMNINSCKVFYYSFGPYLLIGTGGYVISSFLPRFNSHWINILYIGGSFAVFYLLTSFLLSTKEDKAFIKGLIKNE